MMRHAREFQLSDIVANAALALLRNAERRARGQVTAMSLHRWQIAQHRKTAKRYSRIESERRQSLGLDSRPDEGAGLASARAGCMRVLIVDDHSITITGSRARLESDPGAEVFEASDGRAGYSVYFARMPDIAIVNFDLLCLY
jgi:hypothetical protein